MKLIRVDFRNKDFPKIKSAVINRLVEWGLNPKHPGLPKDAIACALDDIHFYEDDSRRAKALLMLEEQILGEATKSMT